MKLYKLNVNRVYKIIMLQMGKNKRKRREVRVLYFTQTNKIIMCTIPKVTIKELYKEVYSENTKDKSKWNSKKCSGNLQEIRKKKTDKKNRRKTK